MVMKTYSTRIGDVKHAWHVLDATDQPLGRLATRAAALLRGKHKPIFQPNLPVGDFVVIVNAEKVRVTGNKAEGKVYYRHTQYPGGLRQTTYRHQMEKFPTRAVEKAVKGMLPHNRLGRKLFTRLKVYAGPEHPHGAQVAESAKPHAPRERPQRQAPVGVAAVEPAETTAMPAVATAAAVAATTATASTEAPTAAPTPETEVPATLETSASAESASAVTTAAPPPATIAETAVPEESLDTSETAPATEE
jgi:large subunit ribosomal protein L13